MIEQGILEPEWALVIDEHLGFGHAPGDDADGLDAADVSPAVRRVVAGLREENHDDLRDAALQDFLDAAAAVESRYLQMLKTLENKLGEKLVRYQGDSPAALVNAFQNIGLKILGPSQEQMLLCADAIGHMTKDAIDAIRQLTEGAEAGDAAGLTDVTLYRSLAGSPLADAADRKSSGAPFNDHSIVLVLKTADAKVLLTGYDVVPAHRLDALDAALRAAVEGQDGDPGDNFMVWSDAIYGDRDGDGMSELAVSRIPDAKAPDFVMRMLACGHSDNSGGGGVRNLQRPYAATIYQGVPGEAAARLLVSEPTRPGDPQLANGVLTAPAVYLMLHGDDTQANQFWGETELHQCITAINVQDITADPCSVVFCGACWGALTVTQRAVNMPAEGLPAPRPVGASMALSFLNAGALAFVGCTGSHYSPEGNDITYYGAPMHQAFWKYFSAGSSPADALFQAKTEYIKGIPHRNTGDPVDTAREMKILREFTCLGLGW